ncbi:MAG: hypothetical protein ACOZAL_01030 [Patescibacteria group bacterium]
MRFNNTIDNNALDKVRKFLRWSQEKQLRINIFASENPKQAKWLEDGLGKVELVSDGRKIWFEQTIGRKVIFLPPDPRINPKTKKVEDYTPLYVASSKMIEMFFMRYGGLLKKQYEEKHKEN